MEKMRGRTLLKLYYGMKTQANLRYQRTWGGTDQQQSRGGRKGGGKKEVGRVTSWGPWCFEGHKKTKKKKTN